jgi:hypothetical protein
MRNVSGKICRKIKTRILLSRNSFSKIVPFMLQRGTFGKARQATHDKMIRQIRFVRRIKKATDALTTFNASCFSMATKDANAPQHCIYTHVCQSG